MRFTLLLAALACALALPALSSAQTPAPAPWLPEPAPAAVDRTPVVERGPSPNYYRGDPLVDWFFLRVAPGVGVHAPEQAAGAASFALDVDLQALLDLSRENGRAVLWPELGYRLLTGGGPVENLVDAGLGLGLRGRTSDAQAVLGVVPAVVYGSALGRAALGGRVTAEWRVFDAPVALGAALSYQVLFTDAGAVHDVVLALSLGLVVKRDRVEADHVAP
jgi:hypothetical protein